MDKLKQLLAVRKKEVEELGQGLKQVRKAELEAARLLKLREEEAKEREEKERKRRNAEALEQQPAKQAKPEPIVQDSPRILPKEEVIRRLRALGQPATLFGEDDMDRAARLKKAEIEVNLEDETVGGQQGNVLLELQRQDKKAGGGKAAKAAAAADVGPTEAAEPSRAGAGGGGGESTPPPEDPTLAAFAAAAARLAEQRSEESLEVEERIVKYIKQWVVEWRADLDARPEEAQQSGAGRQASLVFKQTEKYLDPLYSRLKNREVDTELKAGLWMIVRAMRDRNYLHAYDIYLKLAIGNAPWPIGVTSVGIHERSAREKISHVMNASGQAHIMNDEATRKYLQAIKRLITFVQRMHPAMPSRSVDFNALPDESRGMQGAGSDKLALLQAEQRGELLALPPAVNFMERDGSVKVPDKWKNILAREGVVVDDRDKLNPKRDAPLTPPR